MKIKKEIITVIKDAVTTLEHLKHCVNANYEKAVKIIFRCRGKVIVTGVGKSGIIAQKIAATLVSTGTAAIYLHPTDGMHGSLGVIRKNDIILAIGKSGESAELLGMLPSIRKIGSKIISITANSESTLAKKSDVVLIVKIKKEACPFNLAPTNSTTAALVVGDAIAVTLMKMRKFKPEDFGLLHPGGSLGRKLMRVADIMKSDDENATIKINDSIERMLVEMTEKRVGAVSVIDKKRRLIGFITDFDIRKILERREDIFAKRIKDIMNKKPVFIYSDMKIADALALMQNREKPIAVLPVVDTKHTVVGILHVHDILK
ncbi:MAG: Arabinose 5-phosphate isomerase KdsD [Elusimicrobia bacterium ADurb.Bin231]|nr:MAG: Arabinose 5-phosphate isomerase KdsD [Elusimicrobia bacterium ADurb.Bin231]